MSSGTVFGTLGDPPGPLKTYVFLKEFNDFHYFGNPSFSLIPVAHPRSPGRPPGTDMTPQPHSAPRAVCTLYIVLCTILFSTLRFPKSTATPDHGVGGLVLLGWGWGLGGWVLVGWTGLVLSANPKSAADLVYRSAALVAFLT